MPVFNKPSEAIESLGPADKFFLRQSSGGRPVELLTPDGKREWNKDIFNACLTDGHIPRGSKYFIRPILTTGKASSKKITLDLSLSEESTTVEASGAQEGVAVQQAGGSYVQESVVTALLDSYKDERGLVWELREECDELRSRNTELEVRCAKLESELERLKAGTTSLNEVLNNGIVEFLKGPGGMIVAQRLFPPALASSIGDAASKAASKG